MREIILASASPRRVELLKQIGVDFAVFPSSIEEKVDTSLHPGEIAQTLAHQKASHVAGQYGRNAIVIGADTIVVKEGILGKPSNEEEAFQMLKALRGEWHSVITGVSIVDTANRRSIKAFEETRVKMRDYTDAAIHAYIRTGEPMDKAGSYGIQGVGAILVEKIEGCYFNVVGLPLARLTEMIGNFGISFLG